MSAFGDRVEYAALNGFIGLARSLSEKSARRLARALGDLTFDWIRIRRSVVLKNLRDSFPDKTDREIFRIARESYRHFAQVAVEVARMSRLSREARVAMGELGNPEYLAEVVAMGRGAILLTGHFGNWEWLGSLFPALGYKTKAIVGVHHNRLAGRLFDSIREGLGVGVLSAERDLKGVVAALREGCLVAIVGDQDAGRDGVFVNLLGRPASTAVGPVRLARRYGVPILQVFAIRLPDGRLRAELQPPVMIPADGDESEEILRHTQSLSDRLEDYIRRYPEQWFWMHRRWKTRPKEEGARGGT